MPAVPFIFLLTKLVANTADILNNACAHARTMRRSSMGGREDQFDDQRALISQAGERYECLTNRVTDSRREKESSSLVGTSPAIADNRCSSPFKLSALASIDRVRLALQ